MVFLLILLASQSWKECSSRSNETHSVDSGYLTGEGTMCFTKHTLPHVVHVYVLFQSNFEILML